MTNTENDTQTSNHLSQTRFSELGLEETLLKGIEDSGFEFCTPIQALTLPLALQGKDISGQAQTGTGKTAAFLIATINKLLTSTAPKGTKKNPIRSLILAPTRELAIQILEDGKPLAKATGIKIGIAYGGTDYEKQRTNIEQGLDILIGTPGRIIDYYKQGVFALDALEVIVLDEADRMFDLGFISDIRFLFRNMPTPENRLNLLFSATLSHRVSELAYEHMSEPEVVKIESENITAKGITEIGYMPSNEEKFPLLLGLLKQAENQRCVVFINTKHIAETIQAWLETNNFKSAVLSGDVPQRKRESLLSKFKSGECNILVATDVAARGLHIPEVNFVINFDLPTDAEDYVHRIGRTARAGASGTAISLICETYAMSLIDIEEYIEHSIPIERNLQNIVFKDAVKPDLSHLSRNKKRNSSNKTKPVRSKDNKPSSSKDRAPKRTRPSNDHKPSRTVTKDLGPSPLQKDALSQSANRVPEQRRQPRIPLRGKGNREVPAVG